MMKLILFFSIFYIISCSKQPPLQPNEVKSSLFDSRGNYSGFKSEFVKIKKGEYMMGSTFITAFSDEKPQHKVVISRDFEVMQSEMTQKMWLDLTGTNPSKFIKKKFCKDYTKIGNFVLCPNHPVEMISMDDVQKLLTLLNSKSKNYVYDIPTEEQWEYYARGGTQTNYFWGIFPNDVGQYAHKTNSPKRTTEIKRHKPNPFKLFDTAGNVWEWTKTKYVKRYYDYMYQSDNFGTELESDLYVIRGGGWNSRTDHFRSSYRGKTVPKMKSHDLGVRLIRYRK